MIDVKIKTLMKLESLGSYTKTAEALSLTQPAVTHHIKMLEEQYGIHIFVKGKHKLKPTPEGQILLSYARKAMALDANVEQAIEDSKHGLRSLVVGITPTASDILVPQILAYYCVGHPQTHIQIVRGTIKNIDNMLKFYEIDFAIVDGVIKTESTNSFLLGTDYLSLVVSPKHPFAKRISVSIDEIQNEKLVLRPKKAETRRMFEAYIVSHGYVMKDFQIMMELDSVSNIKDIVADNLGLSIMSHNVCCEEAKSGRLVMVPIDNCQMVRPINLIYPKDFACPEILQDIRDEYTKHFGMR